MITETFSVFDRKLTVSFFPRSITTSLGHRMAIVCIVSNGAEFFSGVAVRHPDEPYDQDMAMKIAYKRAMFAFASHNVVNNKNSPIKNHPIIAIVRATINAIVGAARHARFKYYDQ
jgi:hypothetical protein